MLFFCHIPAAISMTYVRERKNIQQFLSMFVNDVNGFRRLMQKTGAIIIGESAAAFFTGAIQEEMYSLDLAVYNVSLESCTAMLLCG